MSIWPHNFLILGMDHFLIGKLSFLQKNRLAQRRKRSDPKCVGLSWTVSCKIGYRDISENVFQMVVEKLYPKLLQVKVGNVQLDPKIFGSGAQLSTLNKPESQDERTKECLISLQGVSKPECDICEKFLHE